ncbi:MAG: D-alanine--poly(phosphoribitol) ligase subunit DltC [Eggerthellaceae bacterium]|jgi:D-alanine--poly(phosphoribitol) ligase subunit 2|nr:D-alanine--poly(phosphoribitol) ligase subunit DltC [Eggerthellaceae bacterium]
MKARKDMANENIEERIIELLIDITGEEEIGDYRDDDLFEEDVLDSLGAIELLVRLKEEFGIAIAPTELEREEMNSVNKIVERVQERL